MRTVPGIPFLLLLATAIPMWSQTVPPLEFEVVAIRKGAPNATIKPRRAADRVSWDAPLSMFLEYAYDVVYNEIVGNVPGELYSVQAKLSNANASDADVRAMFRAMLVDRLGLKAKRETREVPVYELVVAPSGIRAKPAQEGVKVSLNGGTFPDGFSAALFGMDGRHFIGQAATMADAVKALNTVLDRTVVDGTGLAGRFTFDVLYAAEETSQQATPLPSLTTALQEELGLRLRPAKRPREVLVIESVGPLLEN